MLRVCRISGAPFEISDAHLAFYKKMGAPPPTLCPDERARLRMAVANQRHLFTRTCPMTGRRLITNYPPEAEAVIYDIELWWSDRWDQHASGRDFDFSRPFFGQFLELMQVAPRPNLLRGYQFDENSDYTHHSGQNKNCYLIFDSDGCWDCLYGYSLSACRDVLDSFRAEKCELCYELVDCINCYNSSYLQNCEHCSDSAFLKNCIGCNSCFGCVNLKNKQHYFFNEPLTKEEYERRLASHELHRRSAIRNMSGRFAEFITQFPLRAVEGYRNEDCIGNYLVNSKNAQWCFDSRELWDCTYVQQAFGDCKDCMDCTEIGMAAELVYETSYAGFPAHFVRFSTQLYPKSSYVTYCYYTPSCDHCFGCVGLHHRSYCIFNKQYSREDYDSLVPRIIEHMQQHGEWGEFFPPSITPFAYNLTHAMDFLPLSKDEALRRGFSWRDPEKRDFLPGTFSPRDSIFETGNDILGHTLGCEQCGRNYKIQKPELDFYRKANLPIPLQCPEDRFLARLGKRSPRVLYQVQCARSGKTMYSAIPPAPGREILSEDEFAKAME